MHIIVKKSKKELGLNWPDYRARNYDPALGRWMNINPLSTNRFRKGERVMISEGFQTGSCGKGSLPTYRNFIKNTKGFNGSYYLRSKPALIMPTFVPFSSNILEKQ